VSDETRALINRVTGLVATMAALVLGLLIASANTFYNSQKGDLEILSGRMIELDSMLREYGPDAQPIRDQLKATVTRVYQHTWNSPPPRREPGDDRRNARGLGRDRPLDRRGAAYNRCTEISAVEAARYHSIDPGPAPGDETARLRRDGSRGAACHVISAG